MRGGSIRGMEQRGIPNFAFGVIVVVIIALGSLYAFTKSLPFGNPYEVRVMFENAANVRADAQVRIAGVQVGKVTGVEHVAKADDIGETAEGAPETATLVTMEIGDSGRPLRSDSTFKLRPRLFLEGNLFVEVSPGSPSAPEAADGHVFAVQRGSRAIQLDEILTTLQKPVRRDLQILVAEFGDALVDHGGAKGFRELFRTSPRAFRATAQVNQAFLGTEPHDLSGAISNLDAVLAALGRNQAALGSLVGNLRTTAGSFAAEDEALAAAVAELPAMLEGGVPALEKLDLALPSLRAFAREMTPGVEASVPALRAATPWAAQLAALVGPAELRGLAAGLRTATPPLASLTARTSELLPEARALASCVNEVVAPWANDRVVDPFEPATGSNYQELGYGLVGVSGESRNHDANAPYIRALAGSGANIVEFPPTAGRPEEIVGVTPYPILGAVPAIESSAKTPIRPDVPCETQEPPDLRAVTGDPPQQSAIPASSEPVPEIERLRREYSKVIRAYGAAAQRKQDGAPAAARRLLGDALREHRHFNRKRLPKLNQAIIDLGRRGR